MNENEAKRILLRYRPQTADAEDPQVAEALALAKTNPELARWLEALEVQRAALCANFQQITPPAGLKEQIVSEYAATRRRTALTRSLWVSLPVLVVLLINFAVLWHPRSLTGTALAVFKSQMVRLATGGYGMDIRTNDLVPVRAYLAEHHAPADFKLPAPLEQAQLIGCAATDWRGARVSLVCFRTGKPLPPGSPADLWLFVVDRSAITNSPAAGAPEIAKVNRLYTATWTQGGNLYFLGVAGAEADIKRFL